MRIPKRIYGIENELGVVMQYSNGTYTDVRTGYTKKMHEAHHTLSMRPFVEPVRRWHTNGACSYIDTGEHPEYATPECYSIRDAVLYAKAGEIIMSNMFSEALTNDMRLVLIKNNLGCDPEGSIEGKFGCHENYLTDGLDLKDATTIERFVPFLITRQIMDGAGWWEKGGRFLLAQRSTAIESLTGTTTTSNRPLITKRDTLNDTGPMHRLHLIFGDANILDVACFLKLGTTSLVLSLIESGKAPAIECDSPIRVMHDIASQSDVTIPHETLRYKGKRLSALDSQILYYETAKRECASATFDSEDIQAEMQLVLTLWEQSLNALFSNDEQWMIGNLDYATKRYLAERAIKQKKISSPSAVWELRKTFDLLYHNITDRTLQNRMNIQWQDRRLLTDKQIEKACYFPPQNTRANMRGLFVASTLNMAQRILSAINWTYCKDEDLLHGPRTCDMKDPFSSATPQFIEFLMHCVSLPHNKTFLHSACDAY